LREKSEILREIEELMIIIQSNNSSKGKIHSDRFIVVKRGKITKQNICYCCRVIGIVIYILPNYHPF